MKNWLRVFEFSKREQKGVWILISLIIFSYFGFELYGAYFKNSGEIISKKEFERIVSELNNGKEDASFSKNPEFNIFSFDANKIKEDSLMLLGFSKSLSRRYVNFRNSIGGFKKKADIKRVYGLNDSIYKSIEHFAFINQSDFTVADKYNRLEPPELVGKKESLKSNLATDNLNLPKLKIDLNSALKEDLMKINGVGDVLSRRIIKFRNAIGGFYKISQLFEVYGVDSANLDLSNIDLVVDTTSLNKIDLNSCKLETLSRHIYITLYQAKILMAYREQHGSFKSRLDIMASKAFKEEELIKVWPYISMK